MSAMVPALEQHAALHGGNTERNRSSPTFLDLANSMHCRIHPVFVRFDRRFWIMNKAARTGANLPDVNSMFEEQMRMLEHRQVLEEQKLMGNPAVGGGPMNPAPSLVGGGALQHHPAMSAPTTPPRTNSLLQPLSGTHATHDHDIASTLSHGLAPGSRLSNGSLLSGVSFGTPQSVFHSPANTTEKRKSVN
ncbi:hypothetical protein FRC08_018581 [Ceratobasidium sp. 394]|nr:hypothetical protein FRC08_018581 [Ceratobasidium sp. 394]